MSIKHPEILYALFLLLIPVIIHLVRWKKYKKQLFTNVAFLKELEIKSRRSRKLKEFLVLLLRVLAFAALIFAFSQPYFPSEAEKENLKNAQQIIYLDNSQSMSAPTQNGSLWQDLLQDLVKNLNDEQYYTLFTNNQTFKNLTGKQLKKKLFKIKFSPQSTKHIDQIKKANFLFSNRKKQLKELIYISDLQNVYSEQLDNQLFQPDINYHFYTKQAEGLKNISIDSLWIVSKNADTYHLRIRLSANNQDLHTPVSITQAGQLLWRTTISFRDSLHKHLDVELSGKQIAARVAVKDRGFQFDNSLYFILQKPEKLKVLVVGAVLPDFLKKIYTPDEFVLDVRQSNQIDYGSMQDYDLVILNEVKDLLHLSSAAIYGYVQNFGNLCLIPNMKKPLEFRQMLKQLKISTLVSPDTSKIVLNRIRFAHPLIKNVYLKKTKKFKYPFVKQHFKFSNSKDWIYKLSDNTAFLTQYQYLQGGNVFVFSASLQPDNTNFVQIPSLVVPAFYQIAKIDNKRELTYFIVGRKNEWKVAEKMRSDEVLKLKKKKREYIPFQINQFNNVLLSTTDFPDEEGIYDLEKSNRKIDRIAYNFNRKENLSEYLKIRSNSNVDQMTNLDAYIKHQKEIFGEQAVWKWFLWAAALLLLLEMLVIKFWK